MPNRSWLERQTAGAEVARRRKRSSVYPIRNPYFPSGGFGNYGLPVGGLRNVQSGAGRPGSDRNVDSFFTPTWVTSKYELEVAAEQSWAAKKLINIPVDDALVRWRQAVPPEDEEGDLSEELGIFEEAEERWNLPQIVGRGVRNGRTYGTSLTIVKTREAKLDTPLEPMMVRPGDLIGFTTVNRWQATIAERDTDFMSPTFGEPVMYEIFPRAKEPIRVHASRVMRFDGVKPTDVNGWDAYDRDWGLSVLVAAFSAIVGAHMVSHGSAHLSQEASVGVMKMQGFRDYVGGQEAEEEGDDPHAMSQAISLHKSLYSTMVIDADDEFERVQVNVNGFPNLINAHYTLVAAAGDIPLTRFLSQSPGGLDSTGMSDMKNWALQVAGMQARMITEPLMLADLVIARDAGLEMAPAFEWMPLVDLTEQEQAMVLDLTVKSVVAAVGSFIITEDEAREILARHQMVGALPGPAPEQMDDLEVLEEEEKIKAQYAPKPAPAKA